MASSPRPVLPYLRFTTLWQCKGCKRQWTDDDNAPAVCRWCSTAAVPSTQKRRRLAVNTDNELQRRLVERARAEGVPLGELARRALDAFLSPSSTGAANR